MIITICKYSGKDYKKRKKYKRLQKEGKVKLLEQNKHCFIYEDNRNVEQHNPPITQIWRPI